MIHIFVQAFCFCFCFCILIVITMHRMCIDAVIEQIWEIFLIWICSMFEYLRVMGIQGIIGYHNIMVCVNKVQQKFQTIKMIMLNCRYYFLIISDEATTNIKTQSPVLFLLSQKIINRSYKTWQGAPSSAECNLSSCCFYC